MSKQMETKLRYRYRWDESRTLEDGRIEVETIPYAAWSCVCGEELVSVNLFNGLFYTHCECKRPYSIDWRYGLTPRVLLLFEPITQGER